MSEHIADLERQLGASLFDRAGRSIHPTPEAGILFARANDVIEQMAAIATFRKQHAGVRFQVRAGDSHEIAELVVSHEMTLGIVGSQIVCGRLHYRPLPEDELVVVVPSHGWEEFSTMRRLTKQPAVLREEGSGTRREAERILQAAGVDAAQLACADSSTP